MEKRIYILEHLGCANCAAKIEKRIAELPGVQEATITFATKQLRLTAEDPASLIPEIQKIANSLEPDIVIIERKGRAAAPRIHRSQESDSRDHSHDEHCSCGHHHDEHSHDEHCSCEHHHDEHEHTHTPSSAPAASNWFTKYKEDLLPISLGAILFLIGLVLEHQALELPSILVFLVAYVILGGEILLTAGKNISHGQVFDENFLMSIATIGALCTRDYPEAVGVMLFYRIGELFEHVAVEKSRSQIMDALDLRPEVVNLVSGSDVRVIPAEEAQVGDILLVRPGDRIPLDGRIVEGESRLDTSPITGEPVPVKVSVGEEVISGCVNTSGLLKIRAEKILEESMVSRILDSVENAAASKPKIDRFITRFARIYTPIVVLLAILTAVVPSFVTGDWNHWVYTALTFLVISCPCALVLSVPLAFFSGIGSGSKLGILFKGGVSLEAMKHIKAVVMDKTGTITRGNFVLQKVIPFENKYTKEQLLSLCAGCEQSSTHPIAHSIIHAAKEQELFVPVPSSVEEIAGHGIRAVFHDGEVLCGNRKLMERFGITLDGSRKESYGTEVFVAKNGSFLGHLVISDTLKEEAKPAVAQIQKLGITTVMLTGDAQEAATAIAEATGIQEVHARLLPQEKLQKLQELRQKYGAVMFVGDGINDAPVLAGADVGAAMGSGADAAIEAADVVFMTSSMGAIPQSLAIARHTNRIAWQNVFFALLIKALVMILGLLGHASMWMAVFADTGVAMLCVLNSIRILYKKK